MTVSHPDRLRWGFELTALDSGKHGTGTFKLVDKNITRIVSGSGTFSDRKYVEHTSAGTFAGKPGGTSWDVEWTAPSTDVGRITFYAAGNAANNNNNNTGDSIYTTSVQSQSSGQTPAPTIVGPLYKKGKIVLQDNGSNIHSGATLDVTNADGTETFALAQNRTGTKWQVKKTVTSTPGGKVVDDVWPAGTTVTLVVHNPDGQSSVAVQVSR